MASAFVQELRETPDQGLPLAVQLAQLALELGNLALAALTVLAVTSQRRGVGHKPIKYGDFEGEVPALLRHLQHSIVSFKGRALFGSLSNSVAVRVGHRDRTLAFCSSIGAAARHHGCGDRKPFPSGPSLVYPRA